MKKIILLFLVFSLLLSFCSCFEISSRTPKYNSMNEYLGFSDISEDFTPELAKKIGCFVINNDKLYAGEDCWNTFLRKSKEGKDTFMRIAHFIDENVFYQDLYYYKGKYLLFTKDKDIGVRKEGSFEHLRALVGEDGVPKKEVTMYVLTDSLELTYHDVLWSFYSSSVDTVKKIPFVWLGFTTYLNDTSGSIS